MPTILHIGQHGTIKLQPLLVILKLIVPVKCVKMDMFASIRETVNKNATIFTGINAEKTATKARYCHQQLIADVLMNWRETLCSVKRLMIHYILSLKRRHLNQKNQLEVMNQLGKKLLLQPRLKTLLTMQERQPLHLMIKLTLERNLLNFRRKNLLMSQQLKKRVLQLSQLKVKNSLLKRRLQLQRRLPLQRKLPLQRRLPLQKRLPPQRSLLMNQQLKKRVPQLSQLKVKNSLLKRRLPLQRRLPLLRRLPPLQRRLPLQKRLPPQRSLLMSQLKKKRVPQLSQLKSLLKNLLNHNFQVGYFKEISTIMEFQTFLKAQ